MKTARVRIALVQRQQIAIPTAVLQRVVAFAILGGTCRNSQAIESDRGHLRAHRTLTQYADAAGRRVRTRIARMRLWRSQTPLMEISLAKRSIVNSGALRRSNWIAEAADNHGNVRNLRRVALIHWTRHARRNLQRIRIAFGTQGPNSGLATPELMSSHSDSSSAES